MMVLAIIGLIVLGFLLLFLELFVVPGITIAGIGGGLLLIGGIVLSFNEYGNLVGLITLAVTFGLMLFGLFYAFKSKTWRGITLNKAIDSKVNTLELEEVMAGDKGKAISRLAPMGKILINDQYYEAKTLNDFIDQEAEVEVIKVKNGKIIVKPLNKE